MCPQVMAVHPGMVLTDVVRTLPPLIRRAYVAIMPLLLLTPAEGGAPGGNWGEGGGLLDAVGGRFWLSTSC